MARPSEITFTVQRRRGLALLWAMIRVAPKHYRLLREQHNGRWVSLQVAVCMAMVALVRQT